MPFALIAPKAGRTPCWRVRGTEFGIYIDRSTQTGDKREAQKFLALWRDEAKRAALSGPVAAAPSFAAAALAYMRADGEKRFLAPLLEHFGETPLDEINQAAIDAAAHALYPDATAATRNRQVYSPVSAILKHAGVEKALKRPKGWRSTPRLHWLQEAEAFALMKAAHAVNAKFGALVTLLLYCGCRLSDALSLTWSDVDIARATAFVRKSKNGDPVPLHLPPIVVAALANLDKPKRQSAPVFGTRSKNGRLYIWLNEAAEAAGVTIPAGIAFHIFRHTHAAWRRRKTGADTSALVSTGLWKSHDAARVYEHLDPSEEARKADLLPVPKLKKKR